MENNMMTAAMTVKKLDILKTLKEGVSLALGNYINILLTVVLYAVTVWIPYLNVGTTIAISSLPAELAKGNKLNPTFIFDAKYRKNMGEFFILSVLMVGAILIGMCFMLAPAFVIAIAWCFAILLFVDQNKSALEAIRESNRLTYGNKWNIFFVLFVLYFALNVVTGFISIVFTLIVEFTYVGEWLFIISQLITSLLSLAFVPFTLSANAVMYKELVLERETEINE